MDAIRMEGLSKSYGAVRALDGLDLSIPQGELFALLGVNGAGKTTLLKILSCLAAPTAGDAWINGCSIGKEPLKVKSMIGVSPQETAVAPNLTVRENLELMCGIYGFPKIKWQEKVEALTEEFSLHSVLGRKAGKLSGGWQRRVSIAMALIGEPKVLFLDEPTLGLDVLARSELWGTICSLKGKVTIILTTHYLEEAETLADRIGVLRAGRLTAVGTAEELKMQTGKAQFYEAFVDLIKE